MFIAGLVSIAVLGASLAGETATLLSEALALRKWDFEDGNVSGWTRYDNRVKTPSVNVTKEALSGNYSLNARFDDTSTAKHFDKGFVTGLPNLSWKDFDSISFRYLIEGEVRNIKILHVHLCSQQRGGRWW